MPSLSAKIRLLDQEGNVLWEMKKAYSPPPPGEWPRVIVFKGEAYLKIVGTVADYRLTTMLHLHD